MTHPERTDSALRYLFGTDRWTRSLSLRVRLLLLVGFALLPAIIITAWISVAARQRDQTAALAACSALAHVTAQRQEQAIAATERMLAGLALHPAIAAADADTTAAACRALTSRFPGYTLVLAARADGSVFASSHAGPAISIADRPYFRGVMATRAFSVGTYAIGRLSGKPTLHCSLPILAVDGSIQAVIVAGIDLTWLSQLPLVDEMPPGTEVTVIDRSGTILATTAESKRQIGTNFRAAPGAPVLASDEGQTSGSGPDGVARLYSYVPLDEQRAIGQVIVGVPESIVFAGAHAILRRTLAWVAVGGLVALLAAWHFGGVLIVRPLQALVAITRRLSAGDFSVRPGLVGGRGEIAALARAVEGMAETLAQREGERALAETELRRSHRILAELVAAAPLAVHTMDVDGTIAGVWNPAASTLLGWRADEATGRPAPWVPASDLPAHAAVLARVAAGGSIIGIEVAGQRKDAQRLQLQVFAAPLHGADGAVTGSLWLLADVSEQQRLQARLLETQKLEAVARVAAGVAHDFNNLLTVIVGHAELLAGRLPVGTPGRQDAQRILASGQRAAMLTGRLMAFGRGQAAQPRTLDLDESVADISDLLSHAVGSRVRLSLTRPSMPCLVQADPVQIEQVVTNLVLNARDAMPAGGTVTVGVAEVADLGLRWAELTVADTGMGMDEAVRARLFTPFFTTKPAGKGTGLGLASVKSIVDGMQGTITVDSQPGQGTTFRVRLPLLELREQDRVVEPEDSRRPLRILLVEDQELIRLVAGAALTTAGHHVEAMADADMAQRRFTDDSASWDLLITDAMLGDISGPELARRLRLIRPGFPVLVASGWAAAEAMSGLDDSKACFLPKPFTAQELLAAVRRVTG